MAAALTLALLFALLSWACCQVREAWAQEVDPADLDLDRLRRDMALAARDELRIDDPPDRVPGSAASFTSVAEEREAALSRALIASKIAPAIYRRQMSDLARQKNLVSG